jgi:ferredoxin
LDLEDAEESYRKAAGEFEIAREKNFSLRDNLHIECCYCGSCGAFCKEYTTYENEIPITKKKCHEIYGACYDFCPRTSFAPFEVVI